jgi:hypothetical protein
MLGVRLATVIALVFVVACEKPSHENVDKWTHTKNGESKLDGVLADENADVDLAAHAGANLLRMNKDLDVRRMLEAMPAPRRAQVASKMAARMWDVARVDGELSMPRPEQVHAKDTLVMLRKYVDDAGRPAIDTYLLDWYCVASYDGRAQTGAVLGPTVIRMLGPQAAKKLTPVVDAIVTAPAAGAKHKRIGDELLLALAVSGSPDAVKYLLDLARMKTADPTLAERAVNGLYRAYVDPESLFEVLQDPAPLAANLDAILAIAKDPAVTGNTATEAIKLVRTLGPPRCIAPLVALVAYPHPNPKFKFAAADAALKCGGIPAIKDVVHALPDVPYERAQLFGAVVVDITAMPPPAQVLAILRSLLAEPGRIPRWVAIEGLAAMKSAADAPAMAAVSSSEKLVGYWGDQSDVDPKNRKADPTLGQRAKELAATLK